MTEALFILLTGFAFIHLVWDGILAPSTRLRFRFRLFAARDALVQERIDCPHTIDDQIFEQMYRQLNCAIACLPEYDLVMLVRVRQLLRQNETFRERVRQRIKMLDSCSNQVVQKARQQMGQIASDALLTNSSGWVLLIIPIAVAVVCIDRIRFVAKACVELPPLLAKQLANGSWVSFDHA